MRAVVVVDDADRAKVGRSIIEISSVTVTIMTDNYAAYMGTKAGMDHVIRCVAHEFSDCAQPAMARLNQPIAEHREH